MNLTSSCRRGSLQPLLEDGGEEERGAPGDGPGSRVQELGQPTVATFRRLVVAAVPRGRKGAVVRCRAPEVAPPDFAADPSAATLVLRHG